jgi:hypothetical protein
MGTGSKLGATKYVVLSASRMTDMPAFYPQEIINETEKRLQKGWKIHTLVLWTKHPESLLKEPLRPFLLKIKETGIQIFVQLTISGLAQADVGFFNGQAFSLEPHVPKAIQALECIPKVVDLIGTAERILLRIDPIVRIMDERGVIFSNLPLFEDILARGAKLGIRKVTYSFLEDGIHAKVNRRFAARRCAILSPDKTERERMLQWTRSLSEKYKVDIQACCAVGLPESACIDAALLERLHDQHLPLNRQQPRSRSLCGCSQSVDIGGWPPRKCRSGCLYCYSNPVI